MDGLRNKRIRIRPEMAQQAVARKSTRESPNVKHVIDVLRTSSINLRVDRVCHAGNIGDDGDEEGYDGAPVGAVFVVPVAAVCFVQSWDVDVHFLGDPVVSGANGCDGGEEDAEASHERKE